MKMTISDRIKQCYEHSGARSVRSYALSLGIPERTIGDVINKGVEPRTPFLLAFLNANPQLSAQWLMTGEGPMLKDGKLPTPDVKVQNGINGDKNHHNTFGSTDDGFWKTMLQTLQDTINDLRNTISDLHSRCTSYEQQNHELQQLLDEERARNNK